jgi:hypothetical protein
MRKLFLVLLLAISLFFPIFAFAETIVLKSGKAVEGKIIEKTDKYVKVDFLGVELTYFLDEIDKIEGELLVVPKETKSESLPVEMTPKEIFKTLSPAVVYIETENGFGSGFIIDKSGIIITNYHVVSPAVNYIKVKLKDGREFTPASILEYNGVIDVCILKIDAPENLSFVNLGDENKEEIGDKVLAIGNPMGQQYSLSDGIISQMSENIVRKLIQFTCPISSGSSGGPLLNLKGEVVGIVTRTLFPTDGVSFVSQNINFAIGINQIKRMLANSTKMPLNTFLNKNKENRSWAQNVVSAKNYLKLYDLLKQEFLRCSNINDKDCFCIFLSLLSLNNDVTSDFIVDALKGATDFDPPLALTYVNEGVKIVEQVGGIERIAESYKKYFYPTETSIDKSMEFMFANVYSAACFINAFYGDYNFSYDCYEKYRKYVPQSDYHKVLESVLEHNKARAGKR